MASGLDFSLPEAPRRRQGLFLQWLTLLAAIAAVVLLVLERRAGAPSSEGAPAAPAQGEVDRLKSLATDLEKRTLYVQAEEVWAEYATLAKLSPAEQAELLYRRGKCLKEGGRYAEAARRLSEVDGFQIPREEKRKARQLLLDCLAALGKQDVRDSVARSFAIGEEDRGTAVARVGNDLITREEIRADLTGALTEILKAQGAPLSPQELAQKASQLADEELKSPESSQRAIQQAVSRRVLYREGLERGFADDSTTQDAVARFRRELIANRVIEAETENALRALGPTEIKNHYEANRARFVEKEGMEFSFARFPGAAEAEAAISRLGDPAQAASVKLERAPGAAVSGEPLPGIGPSPEAVAHVLALPEGQVSRQPVDAAGAFYVFRAEKRRPEHQLTLAEAEGRVRADLAQVKRQEAMEGLRKLLTEKFTVEILDPAQKAPTPPAGAPGPAPAPAHAGAAGSTAPTPAPPPAKQP